MKSYLVIPSILFGLSLNVHAQTSVTTTAGGTPGAIAKFSGSSIVENSILSDNYGTLTVNGPIYAASTIVTGGEVISGGTNAGFRVLGGPGDDKNDAPWYGVGQGSLNLNGGGQNAVQVAGYNGLDFETAAGTVVIRGDNGNVGINTDSPEAAFEVNGSIKLTTNSGASITFPDTTVQSTAWNGTTLGGDYAESVDVVGDRVQYEPGDVIVIGSETPGKFSKSANAYSKLVAGVYSTKPGLLGRRTTIDRPDKEAEVPMAMMGIVPTKVSAENGAIQVGDLLVSSSKPGYAMKGTDRDRMLGTVIGKALAPLQTGAGLVEVLVSLQ